MSNENNAGTENKEDFLLENPALMDAIRDALGEDGVTFKNDGPYYDPALMDTIRDALGEDGITFKNDGPYNDPALMDAIRDALVGRDTPDNIGDVSDPKPGVSYITDPGWTDAGAPGSGDTELPSIKDLIASGDICITSGDGIFDDVLENAGIGGVDVSRLDDNGGAVLPNNDTPSSDMSINLNNSGFRI